MYSGNLNDLAPSAYPRSFTCISDGCELDFQPSRTVETYAVTMAETFGSAPFVRTRVPDLTTHYTNLEKLDNTTFWVINKLELVGGVCRVGLIRTYGHIMDIHQVPCLQRGRQDSGVCLCGEATSRIHHQFPGINHLTSLSFIFLI